MTQDEMKKLAMDNGVSLGYGVFIRKNYETVRTELFTCTINELAAYTKAVEARLNHMRECASDSETTAAYREGLRDGRARLLEQLKEFIEKPNVSIYDLARRAACTQHSWTQPTIAPSGTMPPSYLQTCSVCGAQRPV